MSSELDAQDRNTLADRDYAFPAKRKEPINDANHVRNAIARFNQVEDVTDDERREAFRRIKDAAQRFGVNMSESSWQELVGSDPRRSTKIGGNRTRDELYQEAKRRDIKGRSNMTKAELERALRE